MTNNPEFKTMTKISHLHASINQRYSHQIENKQEKGAALVSVLLLLMLLLVISAAILLITGLSNSTTVDIVAEKQAYEAAEAGMQTTLNLLRGNGDNDPISFRDAAVRTLSNKADDWMPEARMSKWLNYTYPASQPDRIPLTSPYNPQDGLAYSVTIASPDAPVAVVTPTPNPNWIDGPVTKPSPQVKPPKPAWHPWNCSHCSWDYTHCSLYNPPNNGTLRADGYGCRHKHCIPPPNWGVKNGDDGYQRLLVKVTGYGPRGARKQLELLVKRVIFDYEAEPLIYIQGSKFGGDLDFKLSGNPKIKFDGGSNIAFAVTNSLDQAILETVINQKDKVEISGKGDDYEIVNADERPKWLASAEETRMMMSDLEKDAQMRGRWFNSFPAGNAGTDAAPQFTFVNGDTTLKSDGAGLLVVTGELTLQANFKFKGLILVLGGGTLNIKGGKGSVEGGFVVAKYNSTGDFLAPSIKISAGEFDFKSNAEQSAFALNTVNMRVLAVREN